MDSVPFVSFLDQGEPPKRKVDVRPRIESLAHYANRVRQTIPEGLNATSGHTAQAIMPAAETELLDLTLTQFNNGQLPSGNMIPMQPPRPAQGTVLMNSNSVKDNTTSNMNPATKPTVEFAVDILLQSIQDGNKAALEAMRSVYSERCLLDGLILTKSWLYSV